MIARRRLTATTVLVLINIAAFIWETLTGGSTDPVSLVRHGALYGPLVDRGEWWRIITAAFLHGGLLHITFNMIALYQVGTFLEMLVGAPSMLAIYFVSMIGSGLSVYKFTYTDVTVGASGAIFGIFGALVAIGLSLGPRGRSLVAQTLPIIGINLAIGFSIPNISNAGHLGGLASGFAAGFLLLAFRRATTPAPIPVEHEEAEAIDGEYEQPEPRAAHDAQETPQP